MIFPLFLGEIPIFARLFCVTIRCTPDAWWAQCPRLGISPHPRNRIDPSNCGEAMGNCCFLWGVLRMGVPQ